MFRLPPPLFIIGSVDLTAPSTPGTYYYGACVDAVTDESDTTNNCSASVQVTVPQPKPDLVVGSPSVNESSPAGGAPFELTATVENHGEGSASTTTLRYYQSAYATISTSDTEVGADAIGGLAASGTSSQSVGSDGARARHVLLRSMRGRGDGRVGHDEQLLDFGGGDGTGGGTATRVQDRNIAGFAELRHGGRVPEL